MESGQAIGLGLELAAAPLAQATARLQLQPALLVAPAPGHGAVDQEGRLRLRRLRVEDERPVLIRQDPGAARVYQRGRVPRRQEARGRRRVRVRQRRPWQVDQLLAVLTAKAS